jgi:hypothetical protein
MPNDKKLVIKINYQNKSGGFPEAETGKIEYLTEWNIKRISGAAAVLCLLAALGGYFWINRSADAHKNKTGSEPDTPADTISELLPQTNGIMGDNKAETIIKKESDEKPVAPPLYPAAAIETRHKAGPEEETASKAINAGQGMVVRGSLARFIINKEPSGAVSLPLALGKNSEQTLYYFTELQNMSGKEIYHEWLYKGKIVFKRPIKITEQRWRTATHKTIRSNAPGNWTVRVTDGQGNILQQIDFKVVAENKE